MALASAFSRTAARADFPTETFSGSPLSNASYGSGIVPGTALQIVSGIVAIGADPASGHGNYLDLFSGFYSSNYDPASNAGSSSVSSVATFDLLVGYTYTLSFDFSRQTFSAGNGPFETSLIASLGSHSVTYPDVAGFYLSFDWQAGGLTWTQAANETGAHVAFTALGDGYSGMLVDNISMVGLPPTVTAPVPEPGDVRADAGRARGGRHWWPSAARRWHLRRLELEQHCADAGGPHADEDLGRRRCRRPQPIQRRRRPRSSPPTG